MTTPNLGLPEITNSLNAHVSVNTGFARIDALLQAGVMTRTTGTPPGSPAAGDTYIIPSAGTTGDWVGHEDEIAVYVSGWTYITPNEGWALYVRDEGLVARWDGTAWVNTLDMTRTPGDFYKQAGTTIERWYGPGYGATALTTGTITVDQLHAFPFVCTRGGVLDRIGFAVTTGVGSSKARVGIYDTVGNSDVRPGNLIIDGGEQLTNTTGVKSTDISGTPVTLVPGALYWLAFLAGTANPTVRCQSLANLVPILGVDNTLAATPGVGWKKAQAYGALPSSFPSVSNSDVLVAAPLPFVAVRFSA